MFKVLIAEDELIVRIGIKNSIDWGKLGMEVIADVSNGQEAMEVYQKEKPDLILTDIKMPVMDGIQLISNIRKNDSHTKIIILTCYEEFDLIHKALKLGVSDYILKLKMLPSDIENILIKVSAELKKENRVQLQTNAVKIDQTFIKEKVIKEYLFYNLYSENKFEEMANKVNFRVSPKRMVLSVMSLDRFEILQNKFDDKQGDLIRFAILNILEEVLNGYQRGEVIHLKDEKYILIFGFSDVISENSINEILRDILARIYYVMETYTDTTVTFAISRIYSGFLSLRSMYNECMTAMEQKYFLPDERYIRFSTAAAYNIKTHLPNKFQNCIREAEKLSENYSREIETGINTLINCVDLHKAEIDNILLRWIHWPVVNLNSHNIYTEGITEIALKYTDVIQKCTTFDEAVNSFLQYVLEIRQYQDNIKCYSREVAEATDFIRKNFQKDISLQQIARHVEMSPSYLSGLFKKELEMNLVEYLNQVRVEKAKEILLKSYLKTYEIADKVGFTDESYFSRIFKRYTGMRPVEYRKKWMPDIKELNNVKDNKKCH